MFKLTLTEEDVKTIAFVGNRYSWSDFLWGYGAEEHELDESDAWQFVEAVDSDMEGGHNAFPMLNPNSDLASKLRDLYMEVTN